MKEKYKYILSKINEKKSIIYIVSLCVYLISTILTTTTVLGEQKISIVLTLIRYLTLSFVILKIIVCDSKKYTKKTWIKIGILISIGIISSIITDNRTIIQYIILIIGAYKIDFEQTIKYVFFSEISTVCLIILLSLIGTIPNRIFGRVGNEVSRYSLGFKYATYPSIYIWYFTLLYLYIRKDKTKWWEYILLLIPNIVIYIFTNTRMELFCSILSIIIVLLYNKLNSTKINNIIKYISQYSMMIFTIISLIFAFTYNSNNKFLTELNEISSGRIALSSEGLKNFGIKPFGNKIEWVGLSLIYSNVYEKAEFNYVDNSYLNILYNFGFIPLILILYGFYEVIKKSQKENFIYCCILIIALHSFINPQLLQMTCNIFLLLFANIIIDEKDEKIEGAENKK